MMTTGTRSIAYNWLHDALIPGGTALLEAICAYPWVALALASDHATRQYHFPFLWISVLIVLPTIVGRLLANVSHVPSLLRRFGLLALVLVLFLLFTKMEALPPVSWLDWHWLAQVVTPWLWHGLASRVGLVLFAWLVAGALLLRGAWLSWDEIMGESAAQWFVGGLAAFGVLFGVLSHSSPAAFAPTEHWLGLMLGVYFLFGLTWLVLIQQEELEERTFRRRQNSVNLSWLVVFCVISAVILLVALVVALAGHGLLQLLERGGLYTILAIWHAIAFLLAEIARLVILLFSLLPHGQGRMIQSHPPPAPLPVTRRPAHVKFPVVWLLVPLAVAVLAVVAYLLRSIRSLPSIRLPRREVAEDEERTSIWSWRLFWQQFLGLFRFQVPLGRRWRPRTVAADGATNVIEFVPPSSVRGLYRAVLEWCRDRGRPRRPGETPREFEPALAEAVPERLAAELTGAYIHVRYGEMPVTEEAVQLLVEQWEEFQREEGEGAREASVSPSLGGTRSWTGPAQREANR